MMQYQYMIIGNSAAAVGCIEGIRQVDSSGSICVVADEPYHTYGRPLISYLLWNKTTEENMMYRPEDFYEKNGVDTKLGIKVTEIRSDKKQVLLEDGSEVGYQKLLVATGSRPFVPSMEGLDRMKQVFSFMTLDDAKALEAALGEQKDKRVLIVGAGLIGLKCAEGITERAKSITVVDLADRILPSILDAAGSAIVQSHIEDHGIQFYLSDSVAEFQDGIAKLKSGVSIEFDVLVIAVGVRPNVELVANAGGETDRGIVTDLHCATTLPDVYAAGDCARSLDITTGQNRVLALLPNAYRQGETAGINMAGGDKQYDDAIPMNAIGFWGLHVITAGSYDGEALTTRDGSTYKKLVVGDNRLKGYIMIDEIKRAGIYTRLIREQTPLDTLDFELMQQKPQLMAFQRTVRDKDLGGAAQ